LGVSPNCVTAAAAMAEEKKTDQTLTELAESNVNQHAEAA